LVLQERGRRLVPEIAFELALAVLAGEVIDPSGCVLETPVNGELNDFQLPGAPQELGPRVNQRPDALSFRVDFTVRVLPRAAAGAVSQLLGTTHGTGETGKLKSTLATHMAPKNDLLENEFKDQEHVIRDRGQFPQYTHGDLFAF
jgi:hypothetical protein